MSQFFYERSELIICAWYDNHQVLTISICLGKDPIYDANHSDRSLRKKIVIK